MLCLKRPCPCGDRLRVREWSSERLHQTPDGLQQTLNRLHQTPDGLQYTIAALLQPIERRSYSSSDPHQVAMRCESSIRGRRNSVARTRPSFRAAQPPVCGALSSTPLPCYCRRPRPLFDASLAWRCPGEAALNSTRSRIYQGTSWRPKSRCLLAPHLRAACQSPVLT